VKDWFAPNSLVGEVMAHQGEAGLLSVKQSAELAFECFRKPFGDCGTDSAHWRQLQKQQRRPLDFPSIVVWIRYESPSGGRVRVLRPGGHSGAATSSAGMHQSWPNGGPGFPSGRYGARLALWRQLQGNHAECSNHACRGTRMRARPSFGRVWRKFDVLEATPVQPRRVRESRLSWACGCVLRLSREVAWRIRRAGGNSGTTHAVCGSHACRGAWNRTCPLSGVQVESGVLELAPEQPRARIKDCACRGLDACCDPFGGSRTAPKRWTHHPGLPRPVRNQPSQRQSADPSLSGDRLRL